MKRLSTILHFLLRLLVGTALAQNSTKCQSLTSDQTQLIFNVVSSPSDPQSYTLTNTGTTLLRVLITPPANTQVGWNNTAFRMIPFYANIEAYGGTAIIHVEIITSTPISTLNESITNNGGGINSVTVQITGTAPLPIQLRSFKAATLNSKGVKLTWTTASETNNYGFYVQRNGVDLSFIAGHGTTLDQHTYSYTDNPGPGQHRYGLKQVDLDGTATFSETILMDVAAPVPTKFSLNQNYPNPFNPSTQIAFSTTKEGPVSLRVYDILGREVATLVNENRKPGEYSERFDATRFASGVYMYVLQSADGRLTSRMILSK